ncbi:MAG: hypothetical protein ACXVW8_15205, partial [Nocardioidaceae bacterium]
MSSVVVAVALALLTTYVAVPVDGVRAVVWLAAGMGCAVTVTLHVRRDRTADTLPGGLLAAGVALLAGGQAMALVGHASPSYADIPRLLAYPALAAAVITFQRDRIRHDRSSLLDALVITVAAAQAGWLALLEPVLYDDTSNLASMAVAGAYPLGDLLMIGVLARLGFSVIGSHDTAARLLLLGLGGGIGAEVAAALLDRPDLAGGWIAGCALVVLAARHPAMTRPPQVPRTVRLTSAWRFVVLLGLACLVPPILVLTH